VSIEGLRGGSPEGLNTAPGVVHCKLKIFVDTVSLEALRGGGGSAEVFSSGPVAVCCKLMICSCYSEHVGAERV
jgi:hypothetical protein